MKNVLMAVAACAALALSATPASAALIPSTTITLKGTVGANNCNFVSSAQTDQSFDSLDVGFKATADIWLYCTSDKTKVPVKIIPKNGAIALDNLSTATNKALYSVKLDYDYDGGLSPGTFVEILAPTDVTSTNEISATIPKFDAGIWGTLRLTATIRDAATATKAGDYQEVLTLRFG